MYLKSLELNGFKSFPDKIELEFDKGLTCVVGPNGSGKSNIGDAVRWVLGEQSSKSLRGSNMQDVIFSGTQKRKAGKFAQVTLNIENRDRALSVESDLVSVSRKLYSNGDSEYIINGDSVRLKDVLELFMDTGLGRDGYSIIGQGRIADIVSGKPQDRREIFEEAAGVAKFRYKKSESERRLSKAEDNILRLKDIITELEDRIGPLKSQSQKAKKYLEYHEQKKDLDVSVGMYKLGKLEDSLEGLEEKLLTAQSEYEALSREVDEAEENAEKTGAERARLSDMIDSLREQARQCEQDSAEMSSSIAVSENDISHISSAISANEQKISELDQNRDGFKDEVKALEQRLTDVRKRIDDLADEEKRAQAELEGVREREDKADKDIKDNSGGVNTLYIKKSELSFTVTKEEAEIVEQKRSIEEIFQSKASVEAEINSLNEELESSDAALSTVTKKLDEYENRLSGYTRLYETKKAQLDKKSDEQRNSELKLQQLKNREAILTDLERSMEGFSYSVKKIVKARDEKRISGIIGTVAQIIRVDSDYSLAIETALGAAMQNVVVESDDCAKRCIRFLKEINGGRATFLPLNTVKPRTLGSARLDADGFVGVASELVDADSRFDNILSSLLGRIVIAEDLTSASAIAKQNGYSFKVVTIDGQVINAGGSFTGGSASKSAGILSRRNEIESIAKKLSELSARQKERDEELSVLKAGVTKLELDIDGEKEQQAVLKEDRVRLEADLKRVNELSAQSKSRLDAMTAGEQTAKARISDAEKNIENAKEELKQTEKKIKDAEREALQSEARLGELKEVRESLSEKLSEIRIGSVTLTKDEQSVLDEIERVKSAADNTKEAKNRLRLEIVGLNEQIAQKNVKIADLKKSILELGDKASALNKSAEDARLEFNSLEEKAESLRARQRAKLTERENVSRELERSEEKKINVTGSIDKLLTSLYDEYELTRSEAAALAKPLENPDEATRLANSLKNKIKALGAVNVNAIEEYEEVSERYERLSTQLADVLKSKSELEKLIADLTERMIAIFSDSFDKINENFKQIFAELFGGGTAELVLTDPENVLESGIEIKVAPPGKVIKNLLSLSGGEQAFVAIAIYFAILKVKPSPFCILDEIEAALDDVNVTKYAQYLRRFTDKTQFILISHRRGTMEESDVLYGVTMQEKGISKLLRLESPQTELDA